MTDFNNVPLHTVGIFIADKMNWKLDQYHPWLTFLTGTGGEFQTMFAPAARAFASLLQENEKLKDAIRTHREDVRADPCWEHDVDLWKTLGDGDISWPHVKEPLTDRMRGCIMYLETHECARRKLLEEGTPAERLQK